MPNKKKPRLGQARQNHTPRNYTRARLLSRLRVQSASVFLTRDWSQAPDLADLLRALKLAPPHARSVTFRHVRFPLAWSLSSTVVCCSQSGQRLVGRIDL